MGKFARGVRRAAGSVERKAENKKVRKMVRAKAIQEARKAKARRLVAKSMRKQAAAPMDPEKVREKLEEAKAEDEPEEVVQAMYLAQIDPKVEPELP